MNIDKTRGRPPEAKVTLDETDIQFLLLIIRGYTNSYAIYLQLKKEAEEKGSKGMVYKNANRRMLLLVQAGVIEEVKYTERVPHGRIDYKLAMKGLEQLIPYILNHQEELKSIIENMDRSGLDTVSFGLLLLEKYTHMTELIHEYHKLVLEDVSDAIYERGGNIYNEFISAVANLYKDIGAVQQKHISDTLVSVKLFDKKTGKIIANYYEEIVDKLERYNIELKIDDKGKDTKRYTLIRSRSETNKKRDRKLAGKDMQALLNVIYIMPEPVKFLKDIVSNIEALVVLPPGELENYYNSKNKTYNLIKTIDK